MKNETELNAVHAIFKLLCLYEFDPVLSQTKRAEIALLYRYLKAYETARPVLPQ